MPLLGQPDASIYENVQPIAWPGQGPAGRASASQGPNAAMVRLGLEEQENEQIRQLAQQYGSDYDGLADAVTQINPKRGMELRSALESSRKEAAARSIEETKGSIQKLDMGARWLQTAAEQPDLYPVIRGELLKQAGPQGQLYDKVLPQPGDPELSDKLTKIVTGIALPTKDYLETKAKAAQLYFDGKKVEGALTLMAGSKTPEQWQHTGEIVKGGGLGKLLETVQTPEAAQAMLTAQQQAKPEDADKPEKLIAQTTGGLTGAAGLELAQYMKANGITDPLDPRLAGVINKIRKEEKQAITINTPGEKKRGVTAGDANKIAEYNSSLADLDILEKTIGPGATGIAAQAGAALPNWATNLTGWGTGAKSRQATIDLVKQVIGKALEGGVLRKEDEVKYAKILPTIGDPEGVVRTKIKGLREAIQQKREEHFSALEDAGYDVSKFRARQAPKAETGGGKRFQILSVK